MNKENLFEKSSKDEPVEGDGFSMREVKPSSSPVGPSLEFRPGETNETALERQKKEEERRKKEESKITPEEKERRAEEQAIEERNWVAESFRVAIKKDGEYSEKLQIKQDGNFDRKKRVDGSLPFITNIGDLSSPEDLYELMHKISDENPDLNVSFETDINGGWIKYCVTKKVETKN